MRCAKFSKQLVDTVNSPDEVTFKESKFFVETKCLLPYLSKSINTKSEKYRKLWENFIGMHDPTLWLDDGRDNNLPILIVNSTSGEITLHDGHHRLLAFKEMRYTVFPIKVVVEDCGEENEFFTKRLPPYLKGNATHERKQVWRANIRTLLTDVYRFNLIKIQSSVYFFLPPRVFLGVRGSVTNSFHQTNGPL